MKKTSIKFAGRRKNRPEIDKNALQSTIDMLAKKHSKSSIRLTYIIMSDDELLQMNKTFLQHDYYTDIITFDLSEKETDVIGELYISMDRIIDNAEQYKVSRETEYVRVLFHGYLHLLGYKDKTQRDQKTMREQEEHCIEIYNQIKTNGELVSRETKQI
jgi:probable rRNA maturation factor